VLGNIKVVMLIGLSVAIFKNEVSSQSLLGVAISLFGVAMYNWSSRSRPKASSRAGLFEMSPTLPFSSSSADPTLSVSRNSRD